MSEAGHDSGGVPSTIVVGTDGSVTAERAVWKAAALAKALGAELIIVTAYNDRAPAGVASAGVVMDSGWASAAHEAAQTCADAAAASVRSSGVPSVRALTLAGDPAESLARATVDEHADLLVVGSKGMQSTARFLLGPIANKVSKRVHCDLLIVETGDSAGT